MISNSENLFRFHRRYVYKILEDCNRTFRHSWNIKKFSRCFYHTSVQNTKTCNVFSKEYRYIYSIHILSIYIWRFNKISKDSSRYRPTWHLSDTRVKNRALCSVIFTILMFQVMLTLAETRIKSILCITVDESPYESCREIVGTRPIRVGPFRSDSVACYGNR